MEQTVTEAMLASIHNEIERELLGRGFERTKHQRRQEDFGHLYSVYETPDRVVRFIWDGREGTVILRVYRRRNWGLKLVKALIGGTAGDEKLLREAVVSRTDVATLSEQELLARLQVVLAKE